jgi:pimeloyl-ACP methyl ester carboxylesterase
LKIARFLFSAEINLISKLGRRRMQIPPPAYLQGPHGRLAYRRRQGFGPGVFWLGGFRSDMLGTKANMVDEWAARRGRAFLRFDYSGHGESDGQFEDGTIGGWTADALAIFDALTSGAQLLVGSSMGAWIATLLALKRPERIAGAVFIAPAPDFTERLLWPSLSDEQRQEIVRRDRLVLPSDDSEEPRVFTRRLIEEARERLVMTGPIAIFAPVRILQGMKDETVPWRHAVAFAQLIKSADIAISLIKNGDHRFSGPGDLKWLESALDEQIGV